MRAATAKQLAAGEQLRMDFESYDGCKFHKAIIERKPLSLRVFVPEAV